MPMLSGTLVGSFPHNTGGQIDVAVETVILALDYISLGLRLWSRTLRKTPYQINDWLMIVAILLMTGRYSVETVAILKCGVGLHVQEIITVGGPDLLILFSKLLYIVDLLWATIVTLVKLSILHFYSVIFPQRSFRRLVYVAMFCCVVFWFGSFFGTAFLCNPPRKKWLPETPGHCNDAITMYVSIVTGDLLTDLTIIALPMPVLWRLHLPLSQKIPIIFAFGLGFAIAAITSIRIKYFLSLDESDPTYTLWPDAVLSAIVPLLGILNANLLIARPALGRIWGSSKTSTKVTRTVDTDNSLHQFKRLQETSIPLSNLDRRHSAHGNNESDRVRVTMSWEVNSALGQGDQYKYENPV